MTASSLPPDTWLGDAEFDASHGVIFDTLVRTLELPADLFPLAYDELVKGVEMDFRHEEDLMETLQCADMAMHRAQHARVLGGLHHACAALMGGDEAPARRALRALVEWLPAHIMTQDQGLLNALRAQRAAVATS